MEDWVKCSGFACSFKLDSSAFFARRFNMLSEDARSAILGMAKFYGFVKACNPDHFKDDIDSDGEMRVTESEMWDFYHAIVSPSSSSDGQTFLRHQLLFYSRLYGVDKTRELFASL